MQKPNFVSGQSSTCELGSFRDGRVGWSYLRYGSQIVTAGIPFGPSPEEALNAFERWCQESDYDPLIFGCEEKDLGSLSGWELTELGRQPLFRAGPEFDPKHSGPDQPKNHSGLRKQARRAASKGITVRELNVAELWSLSNSSALKRLLFQRWRKRPLAEFSFLVEFRLEKGIEEKRAFAAYSETDQSLVGLVVLIPSQRGWLLEHQLLHTKAPNGTGELFLCLILSQYLREGTWLSLGITPLFRELEATAQEGSIKGVLGFFPAPLTTKLMQLWEPFYGFRSLLEHRNRLKPDAWEAVYWAVPQRKTLRDLFLILKTFAGGSLLGFAYATLEKKLQLWSLKFIKDGFPLVNLFYIATLLIWTPILWNLDSVQLFGNPLACKVWAVYDLFLTALFIAHHKHVQRGTPGLTTDLLLGMVTADTLLAWIQTALFHGGLPLDQPFLAALLFLINSAPVSAIVFLILFKIAGKPLPFLRRELPVA